MANSSNDRPAMTNEKIDKQSDQRRSTGLDYSSEQRGVTTSSHRRITPV
jgi:hypothetical protein